MTEYVYLVTRTTTMQTHTKPKFRMKDGTLLEIPFEVGHKHSTSSSEIVTELGDVSPNEQEIIRETESQVVKTEKNTTYDVKQYEKVVCPIDPASVYQMWSVDAADRDDFTSWLLAVIGKSLYVGDSKRASFFITPTLDGKFITMNAKMLWRHA